MSQMAASTPTTAKIANVTMNTMNRGCGTPGSVVPTAREPKTTRTSNPEAM